eukprot:CAMPEP_0114644454 /NCGR_PEP_ID=MMETSP0191-20121206/3967_1 /TAXON_ID=126664 /ORGANISM="Sorites sp." /LENGTH=151 /DNA_ID=CAMNT_0001856899 /DNA_START=30 /DNA_END=483 /DNA_ORIENTATION=+
MRKLGEHEEILKEQNRLIKEHFNISAPALSEPIREWVPPDLHSLTSLQDELEPLLAKASMLVLDALPLEIANAYVEDNAGPIWSASVDPEVNEKAAAGKSGPAPEIEVKIEEQFTALCEAFEHRIREADSFQQRCRSLVDYLQVLKTETVG